MSKWKKKKKRSNGLFVCNAWAHAYVIRMVGYSDRKGKNWRNNQWLRQREEIVEKMPQNRSINAPAHEGGKKRTEFQRKKKRKSKATEIWHKHTNTYMHVREWREHQGQQMIKRVKMTKRKTQNNCCFVNTICCCFYCRCCLGVRPFFYNMCQRL